MILPPYLQVSNDPSRYNSKRCAISDMGYLFTNFDMSGHTINLLCKAYDPSISIDSLPDKYFLAFVYYSLHRYYISDPAKSNYYHTLFTSEWAKSNASRRVYSMGFGGDL